MLQLEKWIKHPERLNEESLQELRECIIRYPYFQTARLLYLKNLFLLKSPEFTDELHRAVLYIADPKVLFYGIESERLKLQAYAEDSIQARGDRTLNLIDRYLYGEMEENPSVSLPMEESQDYTGILMEEAAEINQTESIPMKGQKLIDEFLDKEIPLRKSPAKSFKAVADSPSMQAQDADASGENFCTEALAKIYIKQGRYEKAREIIGMLNLKNPKKSTYFADQLRFLDKLIINAKSK